MHFLNDVKTNEIAFCALTFNEKKKLIERIFAAKIVSFVMIRAV